MKALEQPWFISFHIELVTLKPQRSSPTYSSTFFGSDDIQSKDVLLGFSFLFHVLSVKKSKTRLFEFLPNKSIDIFNKNLPILLIAGTKDPVSDFGKGMDSLYEMLNKIFTNINNVKINNDRHEVFSGLKKELAYNELISFIKSI